jgi:hypothetical protein
VRSANDRLKFTEAIVEPIDVRWHAHARIALTAGKGVDAVPETCSMRSALALAQAGSSPETRQWSERSGAGCLWRNRRRSLYEGESNEGLCVA